MLRIIIIIIIWSIVKISAHKNTHTNSTSPDLYPIINLASGAMDCVCLVCVCAGLCGGTYLAPQAPSDRALSLRGLKINLTWGDFVECGYPYVHVHHEAQPARGVPNPNHATRFL